MELPDKDARIPAAAADRGERPTGSVPIAVGWCALILGVIMLIASFGQKPSDTDIILSSGGFASADAIGRVAHASAKAWLFQVLAAASFSLFAFFWGVGYIVRAISFLPANGDAAE